MLTTADYITIIQSIFIVMTVLLVTLSVMLFNRSKHLKRKLSALLETLALRTKELDEVKSASQNLLSPFIPETSRSIIISIDPAGKIIDVNDYAAEIFGYTREELVDKDAFDTIFIKKDKKDNRPDIIARILANPKLYVEHETENIKKSGEHFWISWTNRIIYDDAGNPIELRSVGFDITKRKRLEEELRYLESIDPLTGVLNRQALLETGTHELKRAQRYRRDLTVVVMQLDYFHDTTDQRGLSDDIVRQILSMCQASIRDSDYIGRIGDVEFAIILPETTKEEAKVLTTRLKEIIQETNAKYKGSLYITTHFGVSEKTSTKDSIDNLILKAFNSIQKSSHTKKRKK